ncbi:hypothetical protein MMC10_010798 [Thelotrema lepadinum]|nr:hypothetical protein [Thelotrema lepadinum]
MVEENGFEGDYGEIASSLSVQSYELFKRSGDLDVLDGAIGFARVALFYTPRHHDDEGGRIDNLGNMLGSRYDRTGDVSYLEAAITVAQDALDSVPEDDPDRNICLSNLATKLIIRFNRQGNQADLDRSVVLVQEAVNITREGSPRYVSFLNNLSNILGTRYSHAHNMADFDASLAAMRRIVASASVLDPNRSNYHKNLGLKLAERFELRGDRGDIDMAIAAARDACDISRQGPDRVSCFDTLMAHLKNRYERFGNLPDLEDAVKTARAIVEQTPRDHPSLARRRKHFVELLQDRFARTGDTAHLEAALRVINTALQDGLVNEEDSIDNPFGRSGWLDSLGVLLERRYERLGKLDDLNSAISKGEEVVQMTPKGHQTRVGRLNNLAYRLHLRYQRTEQMTDLERAISVIQKAIHESYEGHPHRPACLGNLGLMLRSRCERTEDLSDLDGAVTATREALALTPEDHPDRPMYLNNLGIALGRQWEATGEADMASLDAAISTFEQALDLTPLDHADRVARSGNLANFLEIRYLRFPARNMSDLENAIDLAREAVDSTPEESPDRAIWCNNLGNKIQRRYEQTQDVDDLGEVYQYYLEAWNCHGTIPFHRITAVVPILRIAYRFQDWDTAVAIAEEAINLLPIVNSKSLDRKDRQAVMSTFDGLAAYTCAIFHEIGNHQDALRYLERGRVVILGELIDSWSDISRLKKDHPELAGRFELLWRTVNSSAESLDSEDRSRRPSANAAEGLASCLRSIRALRGFERFRSENSIDEMLSCAADGMIIVVNITDIRSDAMVISSTSVKSLHLPNISTSEAQKWLRKDWSGGGRSDRGTKNREYREYLLWLWDNCVAKILKNIGLEPLSPDGSAPEQLPRIWWVGTGLATSMPLHAAGVHEPGSTDNVFSRAISSYTPSIKALSFSKSRAGSTPAVGSGLLLATMPTTPGGNPLPGVTSEKRAILDATDGSATVEALDQPNVDQVMAGLGRCSIAHFACHGMTDPRDPSNSGLLLQKANASGEPVVDLLTVQRISETAVERARVAYLSACSTAENKTRRLEDEVIHVVSGFQVAGFAHAIGCLWPSVDRICADVARHFYSSLVRDGALVLENREIAFALHQSIQHIRAREWKSPLNWAQFVHFGA